MPSGFLDRLQRILPLANKVADEILCEETELLERIIPEMFEVIHRVARFSCDYVKRGGRVHVLGLPSADDRSENGRRVSLPGGDRRNG